MAVRYFALIAGILYIGAGVLGFVPGAVQPAAEGAPELSVASGYGYLFGLFAVNIVHNVIHLGIGVLGLAAYFQGATWARQFARGLAIVYGVLAVIGLIPALSTTFGLAPLFGHDVWLHAATAVVAAYFGFIAPVKAATEPAQPARA